MHKTLLRLWKNSLAFTLLCALAVQLPCVAQEAGEPLNVLIVTAHPDDETVFAATVYRLAHDLGANVDLALISDGSGGFAHAKPSERIYGVELSDESIARHHLPRIRKQELMAGGNIMGIRNYFFMDQLDHEYTTDIDTVMNHIWDIGLVRQRLGDILDRVPYDYALVMLPVPGTHGHHATASILALETIGGLPAEQRPIVLGGHLTNEPERIDFTGLPEYPATSVNGDREQFTFDKSTPMTEDGIVTYMTITNWVMAEHKSQAGLQGFFNWGPHENFLFFDINDEERLPEVRELFERLAEPGF